ncbi:MAG: Tim44/TimA family putative adaptor protein [Candidatus Liberibacter ctenarytainae]|uniref:Tim44/TimA family putative adaptor protein n=1 Tax=Candidatus Liberibacter ctenarytainae TaxID=2020335 RepID=A0A937DKZ2_9HYPH|nr:Tim44/TimA family putative adaptor protein [Candidatus Liberibacter ctenarytainae]
MDLGDFLIFFFLLLTVFVFLRLHSVLGKRTGCEKPFAGFKKYALSPLKHDKWKVVSEKDKKQENFDFIDVNFPVGTPLNKSLRDIVTVYPGFNLKDLLSELRDAYEVIVSAFLNGNIKDIEKLINGKVYEDFTKYLSTQHHGDKFIKSSLVGIDDVKVVNAIIEDNNIYITTRIVGQFISSSYDKENVLILSDPEVFGKVVDIWTFVREISSNNPSWKLISTEPGS